MTVIHVTCTLVHLTCTALYLTKYCKLILVSKLSLKSPVRTENDYQIEANTIGLTCARLYCTIERVSLLQSLFVG